MGLVPLGLSEFDPLTRKELIQKIAELQRKLDEQAKQEPVAYLRDDNNDHNLPAMIEQARAEEREACAKVCDSVCNEWAPSNTSHGAAICADAIRAMGEKK